MKRNVVPTIAAISGLLAVAGGIAVAAQDRYTVKVPGGLAFSEFRGYENWATIAVSENIGLIDVIVGNPAMMAAMRSGIPGNGKKIPDGAKMAKIHWVPNKRADQPGGPTVPGNLDDIDFMVKDSKRFADSGGWGWAVFEYDAATDTFRPGNMTDKPPQGNDAKCGFSCHSGAASTDYVWTAYPKR